MKKIISLLLILLAVLSFTACGGGDDAYEPTPSPDITAAPTPTPEPTPIPEWTDVTGEYEAWVDDYIATYKAAMANPTDNALFDKLEDMGNEAGKWDKRLSDMEIALIGAPDQQEYIDEVLRITQKLNDFVQSQST